MWRRAPSRPVAAERTRAARVVQRMLVQTIRQSLTTLGVLTAHPLALGIVGAYAALWLIFRPQTFDWHAVAVLASWFVTLLIQRAEQRDTQAIHATLDELLSAN